MRYTGKPPSAKAVLTLTSRYTAKQWTELASVSLVVAAYDDKQLVGLTHAHGNGVDWTIEQSIVDSDYRRQGIGTELRIRINKACADQTNHGGTIRGILNRPSEKFWRALPGMKMKRLYFGIRRIE